MYGGLYSGLLKGFFKGGYKESGHSSYNDRKNLEHAAETQGRRLKKCL